MAPYGKPVEQELSQKASSLEARDQHRLAVGHMLSQQLSHGVNVVTLDCTLSTPFPRHLQQERAHLVQPELEAAPFDLPADLSHLHQLLQEELVQLEALGHPALTSGYLWHHLLHLLRYYS